MRHAVALAVLLGMTNAFTPACDSYGASESEPATNTARSVKCRDSTTCAGDDLCCVDVTSRTSCSTSCSDISLACDDTADCAPSGRVCCVDILLRSGEGPKVTGATCRPAQDCPIGAVPPELGPARFRGCDPVGADCEGKGCAPLKVRYADIVPSSLPVYVCD